MELGKKRPNEIELFSEDKDEDKGRGFERRCFIKTGGEHDGEKRIWAFSSSRESITIGNISSVPKVDSNPSIGFLSLSLGMPMRSFASHS